MRPEDNEQKVYREVNSLSRVSHHHIVRYYGCWLEDANRPDVPIAESVGTADSTTPSASNDDDEDIFATNFDDLSLRHDRSRSASFPRIRFANSGEDGEDEDDDDDDDDSDETSVSSAGTVDPSQPRGRKGMSSVPIPSKPSASITGTTTDDDTVQRILYIQMEFVEKVSQNHRQASLCC